MASTLLVLFAFGVAFLLPFLLHWYSQPRTVYIYTAGDCSVSTRKDGSRHRDGKIDIRTSRGTLSAFIESWRVYGWSDRSVPAYVMLVKRPFRRLAVERLAFTEAGYYFTIPSFKQRGHTTYYFLLSIASLLGFCVEVVSLTEPGLLHRVAIFFAAALIYSECCFRAARYFQRALRKKD